MIYDVIIIGGGAAGLMAGCALSKAGARVAILEKQARVGRKLLSTGNGRCNLGNLNADKKSFHGDQRLIDASLSAYPPAKIIEAFEAIGISTRADAEGRLYPMSNQASSVLDALRLACDENGCETICNFHVQSLTCQKDTYKAASADGQTAFGRCAIVCTGGLAAPKLGACADGYRLLEHFGHKSTRRMPALAPLKTSAELVRPLKGLRATCDLSLMINGHAAQIERGEILFTEYGLSGIAAMQLSRAAGQALSEQKRATLQIDFLCGADARDAINSRVNYLPKRPLEDFLTGIIPKRIAQSLLKSAGISALTRCASTLTNEEIQAIARAVSAWKLPITGVQGFENAQVTAGGTDAQDFDKHTLCSKLSRGLYASGEVLNVDGDCGGYNLHWAWASALMCANSICHELKQNDAK